MAYSTAKSLVERKLHFVPAKDTSSRILPGELSGAYFGHFWEIWSYGKEQGCYIASDPGNFRKFPRKFPPGRNTILPPKLEEMEEIKKLQKKMYFSVTKTAKQLWL